MTRAYEDFISTPLADRDDTIAALRAELASRDATVAKLEAENADRNTTIDRLCDSMNSAPGQCQAAERYGFEPGYLQNAWRDGLRSNREELAWAVIDALGMGGVAAHPGDGVGCVTHIIERQMDRAEAAEKVLREIWHFMRNPDLGDAYQTIAKWIAAAQKQGSGE